MRHCKMFQLSEHYQLAVAAKLKPNARAQYVRHRPEQTALYQLIQQHAATFFMLAQDATGSSLPRYEKDEFDAFSNAEFLLTASDFDRTLKPNSSAGTEHAWGNEQFVVGGGVTAKVMVGRYQTLALSEIDGTADPTKSWEFQGPWTPSIAVTQFAGALLKWLHPTKDLNAVLPGLNVFSTSGGLGFMKLRRVDPLVENPISSGLVEVSMEPFKQHMFKSAAESLSICNRQLSELGSAEGNGAAFREANLAIDRLAIAIDTRLKDFNSPPGLPLDRQVRISKLINKQAYSEALLQANLLLAWAQTQEADRDLSTSVALGALGQIHQAAGRYDKALSFFERSLFF
jgi:tetratricopeptide (TPR) repeat protein